MFKTNAESYRGEHFAQRVDNLLEVDNICNLKCILWNDFERCLVQYIILYIKKNVQRHYNSDVIQ